MNTAPAMQAGAPGPRYGIIRKVALSYEQAVEKVTEALAEQGFGILTEIDVK
ncbi:MAG: hypothetical protein GWO39_07915, partial [Gammaproteobacteria bacterium]|nr:hypothetical protein [Gammaproteobacteria bacterium]NIT63703.1 hypothetical protein [Gammaproteobacteria bacterium]NIV20662.1 hypothetical protein [Gammaproteobacteria bacterium]NIY32283.1 hypothetical protein [Gammaproteobacteria bacterium]